MNTIQEQKGSYVDLIEILKSFQKLNNIELHNLLFNLKEKIEKERFKSICNKVRIKNEFKDIICSVDDNLSLTERLKKLLVLIEKI